MPGQVRRVIPEAMRPPPISSPLSPLLTPALWQDPSSSPGPGQPQPGWPKRRCVGCSPDSRPLGLELTGLHAGSPADSACPRSSCRPSQCALKVARGTTAARTHLPLGSRRCAPRPPALSPVLASSCEAARRASCAKACGEGGRVTGCKGSLGSAPRPAP